ncbi:MAG TPA: hypothetical protein VKA25_04595 [Gemmatimonadales bacterium]|nr:hypothetical protein [Gemmatimonadales bacterium]
MFATFIWDKIAAGVLAGLDVVSAGGAAMGIVSWLLIPPAPLLALSDPP